MYAAAEISLPRLDIQQEHVTDSTAYTAHTHSERYRCTRVHLVFMAVLGVCWGITTSVIYRWTNRKSATSRDTQLFTVRAQSARSPRAASTPEQSFLHCLHWPSCASALPAVEFLKCEILLRIYLFKTLNIKDYTLINKLRDILTINMRI